MWTSKNLATKIDGWILDEFKRIGLDTAKSVLALSVGELVKRTDLEERNRERCTSILQAEFE